MAVTATYLEVLIAIKTTSLQRGRVDGYVTFERKRLLITVSFRTVEECFPILSVVQVRILPLRLSVKQILNQVTSVRNMQPLTIVS